MVICFLFNFADFSLIEINFSYRRFWNFVLGSYPSMWYSISLRSFVNRTKWPSETRLFQFANFSQTGTAVYVSQIFIHHQLRAGEPLSDVSLKKIQINKKCHNEWNTLRFQFAKSSQTETIWFPKATLSGLQRTLAKLNLTTWVTNSIRNSKIWFTKNLFR